METELHGFDHSCWSSLTFPYVCFETEVSSCTQLSRWVDPVNPYSDSYSGIIMFFFSPFLIISNIVAFLIDTEHWVNKFLEIRIITPWSTSWAVMVSLEPIISCVSLGLNFKNLKNHVSSFIHVILDETEKTRTEYAYNLKAGLLLSRLRLVVWLTWTTWGTADGFGDFLCSTKSSEIVCI